MASSSSSSSSSSYNGSSNGLKLKFLSLSLLYICLSILFMTTTFLLIKTHWILLHRLENDFSDKTTTTARLMNRNRIHPLQRKLYYPSFNFLAKVFEGRKMKIALVNVGEEEEAQWELERLGDTSLVRFDRVPEDRRWEEFFPEWIDEEEKWRRPTCPDIPMPRFEEYGDDFDVIVSRVPCGNGNGKGEEEEKEGGHEQGMRDVFRLQVNLVVANLVVSSSSSSISSKGVHRTVYVVFIGSCGPMWEIFRCDDLLRHDGDEIWVYKPNLRRLKQKVLMPFGTCQLALPYMQQGDGKLLVYDFSRLSNPIDHPREAYVTILHSSEAYVCGAIVLAQSIIQTNSTKDLVLLADDSITQKSLRALKAAGWKIKHIDRIPSPHAVKYAYNKWNYSKLRIWQLTAYDKILFIDSDLIILKNIDSFFAHPQLSAVGNDKVLFNSGIMLIEPSNCVFEMLMKKRHTLNSYNGGDQGFLNEVFTWWHRFPAKLNYLKIFKQYTTGNDTLHELLPESLYAIHYLGLKPWMCYRDYDCNWDMVDHHPFASDLAHRRWWQVYDAIPKKLQGYCVLTKSMDARLKKWRSRAQEASLPDGHWKIKVKDPRQHH